MSDVAHGLFIKYGLQHEPTDAEVRRWRDETKRLISRGFSADEAGNVAAKAIFHDFNTAVYASEADTIAALLQAAEGK